MSEVFNQREGILSWVSASANTSGWSTAAMSPSGNAIAFVRNFAFGSAQTINTVMNRGTPHHHKLVDRQPIAASFTYGYSGGSGVPDYPVHLEFKMAGAAGASAFYQIHNARRTTHDFTEEANENTMADAFVGLSMVGPTGSGYLTT